MKVAAVVGLVMPCAAQVSVDNAAQAYRQVLDSLGTYEAMAHLTVMDHGKLTVEVDYRWRQDLRAKRLAYAPEPGSVKPASSYLARNYYPDFMAYDGRFFWLQRSEKNRVLTRTTTRPAEQERVRLEAVKSFIVLAPTSLVCASPHLTGSLPEQNLRYEAHEDASQGRPLIKLEAKWFASHGGVERFMSRAFTVWLDPAWDGLPRCFEQYQNDPAHPVTLDGVKANLPIATLVLTRSVITQAVRINGRWFPTQGEIASYRMGEPNGNVLQFLVDPASVKFEGDFSELAFRPRLDRRTNVEALADGRAAIFTNRDGIETLTGDKLQSLVESRLRSSAPRP